MLTLGLAGCGGNEPAPVVAPPAPPPAPPPFQPQAVEVALGDNGGAITLMTTEAGGYTLSGEAFAGGAENPVAGEGGRMYVLTLADGSWSAAFQPMAVEVMLGASGESVTLMTTEAGGYVMGEDAFVSGGTAMSSGGGTYALTMAEDGTWTAAFQPMAVEVPLGASGETVTLTSTEAGGYALPDGTVVTAETTYTTASGRTYGVALGADGRPMPVYVPEAVMAALGELGGMLTLYRQEDGSFLNAEGLPVQAGMEVMAAGNTYTLGMADGVWVGTYKPVERTAALGTAGGSATLVRAEDGSWWLGDLAVASGSTTEAMNEAGDTNTYTLTLGADGRWTAAYTPAALEIAGTGLEVTRDEDGGGYSVVGMAAVTLPASGAGDITTADGATYRVMKDAEGMLAGLRYALPVKAGVMSENAKGTHAAPALSADARDTAANEAGTLLKALGADFPVGELLDGGTAEVTGPNIVEGVLADITKYRDQVAQLLSLRRDGGITTAAFDTQVGNKWTAAEKELENIFPAGVDLEETTSESRVVGAFDRLVDALSSLEAFQAATLADGPDKIAGFQNRNATQAGAAFNRSKHSSVATLGTLGSTRFGAAMYNETLRAVAGLGAAERAQAFAWSTMDAVRLSTDVQASGNAYYSGGTRAVDEKGNLYEGSIEIEVRFTRESVDGLVSDLLRVDTGDSWSHGLGGDVTSITLPSARLDRIGRWVGTASASNRGRISYLAQAGGSPDLLFEGGKFNGRLLGRGAEAGREAYGTWLVEPGGSTMLAGGFGAQRGPDREDPAQPLIGDLKTSLSSATRGSQPPIDVITFEKLQADTEGFSTRAAFVSFLNVESKTGEEPTTTIASNNANIVVNGLISAGTRRPDPWSTATPPAGFDPRSWKRYPHPDFKFTLNRETLFGGGYAVQSPDQDALKAMHEIKSKTYVARAREEITRLEAQLRSVVALDNADADASLQKFANDQRQSIFNQIQEQLTSHIFGPGNADNYTGVLTREPTSLSSTAKWTSHEDYPVNSAGDPQDSGVFGEIGDVIAALQSPEALEDAFDTGGVFSALNARRTYNGVLYTYLPVSLEAAASDGSRAYKDEPEIGLVLPISHIWNASPSRLLLVTDSTNFTRFGAWRTQRLGHPRDGGYATFTGGSATYRGYNGFFQNREYGEPFAYSPLAQVAYSSAADISYPGGLQATYVGRTVAVQHTIFMTGDVLARVKWDDSWAGSVGDASRKIGDLRVTVSNLRATDSAFGPLRHGLVDYKSEVVRRNTVPRPGTLDVRSLEFSADVSVDGDGNVQFKQPSNFKVTVRHETVAATCTGGTCPSKVPAGAGTSGDPYVDPIKLLDANGMPTGANIYTAQPGPSTQVAHPNNAEARPGHPHRLAFDYYYTSGPGKDKLNVGTTGSDGLNLQAEISGSFVGNTIDGPMGLIGTWGIIGGSRLNGSSRHWLGVGNHRGPIYGSFGAEIQP